MPDLRFACAVHEAGHAVAQLAAGCRVDEMDLTRCSWNARIDADPVAAAVAALAGGVAVEMLAGPGSRVGAMSPEDMELLERATGVLPGRTQRWLRAQAEEFVGRQEGAIRWLADRLLAAGRLDAAALGRLCRVAGSPLRAYAKLYPPPEPPPPPPAPDAAPRRGRGRVLTIQSVTRSGLF